MRELDPHPSDDELLLAAEGALTPQRREAIATHLARCAACERRAAAFDLVAAQVNDVYRDAFGSPPGVHARARAALRSKLDDQAEVWSGAWMMRLRAALAPARRWGLVAAGITAAILWARWPMSTGPVAPKPPAVEREALPVAALTPGATSPLSAEALCAGTRAVQPITPAMRQQVLRDYGMVAVPEDQYELDYLITPELGGATDARNLWPQRYGQRTWNALVKDQLEDLLPQLVCNGELALAAAQRDMARDWIRAYQKYFRTPVPLHASAAQRTGDQEPSYRLAMASDVPSLAWARRAQ